MQWRSLRMEASLPCRGAALALSDKSHVQTGVDLVTLGKWLLIVIGYKNKSPFLLILLTNYYRNWKR
jgi:hypothetical protein